MNGNDTGANLIAVLGSFSSLADYEKAVGGALPGRHLDAVADQKIRQEHRQLDFADAEAHYLLSKWPSPSEKALLDDLINELTATRLSLNQVNWADTAKVEEFERYLTSSHAEFKEQWDPLFCMPAKGCDVRNGGIPSGHAASGKRIAQIGVRSGAWIDRIYVTYTNGNPERFFYYGQESGTDRGPFTLADGEYINKVEGGYGDCIDWLTFHTNRGQVYGPHGNTAGGTHFTTPTKEIVGFEVTSGSRLDSITFWYKSKDN
ncbi:Jacalin-like lectin domain-containing protein [Tribonema minus]|uniref:Jacalin-like lectin domain-containing protein n=1 Tax=Tribonema minus TaxID=303371 RepID=A0A835YL70_9STRA|nr:Jacalin-like lectin domain-containing protein [Tribonema minus]